MTDALISFRAALEKGADADLLREMISFAAERLMEMRWAPSPAPLTARKALAQRNGYRERD